MNECRQRQTSRTSLLEVPILRHFLDGYTQLEVDLKTFSSKIAYEISRHLLVVYLGVYGTSEQPAIDCAGFIVHIWLHIWLSMYICIYLFTARRLWQ